jgi:hypothetical protein
MPADQNYKNLQLNVIQNRTVTTSERATSGIEKPVLFLVTQAPNLFVQQQVSISICQGVRKWVKLVDCYEKYISLEK